MRHRTRELLVMVVVATALHVAPLPAQMTEQRITLTIENETLRHALQEIARLGNVEIAYSADIVPVDLLVSVRLRRATVDDALEAVLAATGITFTRMADRRIALHRPVPNRASRSPQLGGATLVGVVLEWASGEPLPNATLSVGAGRRTALTNSDGTFRIPVPAGDQLLRASGLGYRDTTLIVRAGGTYTEPIAIVLRPQALPMDELVVAGTVVPTARRRVPGPVTLITAAEIEQQGVATIADLLRGQVPGIVSPDNGPAAEEYGAGRGTYVRGGSRLGANSSNSVKVYIDGIELADPRQLHSIDPAMIERIEILRGPQASTIYGSGALDGVIHVFMRKGFASTRPRVELISAAGAIADDDGAGFAPVLDQRLSIRGGGRRLAYSAGASYAYTGDWMPDFYSDTRSAYGVVQLGRGRFNATLLGRLSERQSALGINPYTREQIVTGEYAHTPAGVAPYNTRFEMESLTAGMTLEYTTGRRWHHALTIGADRSDFDGGRHSPTYYWPGDTMVNRFITTTQRTTFAYRGTAALGGDGHALVTFGADGWQWTNERSTREPTHRHNLGVFAQTQLDLGGGVALTGGVRADRNDNVGADVGFVVAPRIGVACTRELGAWAVKLRSSYGAAIRAPIEGYRDFYMVTATQEHAANPDLAPERQRGVDAGIDIYFGNTLALEATVYDQEVRDLIAEAYLVEREDYRLRQHQNMGDVRNRGLELQLSADFAPVSVDATYSLIDSRVLRLAPLYRGDMQPGERLHGVARNTGAVAATWTLGETTLGARFTHIGESRQTDARAYETASRARFIVQPIVRTDFITDHYPAVSRLQLSVDRRFGEALELFGRADNVTGTRITDVTNDAPAPGRQFVVGAKVVF